MLAPPPFVSADGDLEIHNQGASQLVINFTDDLGAPRDVSASTIYFEASNGHRILLTAGATSDQKVLTIAQHALDDILDTVSEFAIIDETLANHRVEWRGRILVSGWIG